MCARESGVQEQKGGMWVGTSTALSACIWWRAPTPGALPCARASGVGGRRATRNAAGQLSDRGIPRATRPRRVASGGPRPWGSRPFAQVFPMFSASAARAGSVLGAAPGWGGKPRRKRRRGGPVGGAAQPACSSGNQQEMAMSATPCACKPKRKGKRKGVCEGGKARA